MACKGFFVLVRLARLRLKNFKSFRKAEIPLKQGFTAIAGANGSGKSNILDSILFVLGITSMKALRAGKMAELVNHDSQQAEVTIELESDEPGLHERKRRYEVSRMIDREGKSVCRIDRKKCTLNEVASLLKSLNIKPQGYNIVIQGDIARVIEMNPSERRQIIDEIAGITEFDEKKKEALRELGRVEEKIKDARLVLGEREAYLTRLEQEKNTALKHVDLNNELKKCKATIIAFEMDSNKKKFREGKAREQQIRKELEKLNQKKEVLLNELNGLQKRVEEINAFLIASGERQHELVGRDLEAIKAELKTTLERIEEKNAELARMQAKKQQSMQRVKELGREKSEKELKQVNLRTRIEPLEKEISELEEKRKSHLELLGLKSRELREKELNLKELNEVINIKKEKLFAFNKEASVIEKEMTLLKEQNEKIILENEKTSNLIKALEGKARELNAEHSGIEKSFSKKVLELKEKELMKARALVQSRELEKALKGLDSVKKKCPVCRKNLEEKELKELKKHYFAESRKLSQRLIQLDKEITEAGNELNRLTKARENYLALNERINALATSKEQLNRILGEKDPERLGNALKEKKLKIKETESDLNAALKQWNELNASLNKQRELMQSKDFNELEKKLNAFKKELSELQHEIHSLKTESELVLSNRIKELEKEIVLVDEEHSFKEKEIAGKKQRINQLKEEQAKLEIKMQEFVKENKKLLSEKESLLIEQDSLNDAINGISTDQGILESEKQELLIDAGRVEVRLQDLEEESREFRQVEVIQAANINELRDKVPFLEEEIRGLGAVNLKAIDAFTEFGDELIEVREKSQKLDDEKNAVLKMIGEIDVKRDNAFNECFGAIAENFSEIYANLAGTEGRLGLTEAEEHLEKGLIIEARYSEGKLKSIDLMSGGEKSLTALTFLFAIQHYDAAPFYIFDEADAALDKENSVKLAKLVKRISKNTQFIAITHNDLMLQEADQIIGVALNKDKSSVVGLKLKQELAGEENSQALQA